MGWERGEWQQPKGAGAQQGCTGHTPHAAVQAGCSREPLADLQLSLLSPGKVTSGNLGNSKAGEAGGESFLQYSRDHDRTFISTLMSGGISSPGGRACPTLLLTLFMRFLTFPAMKQQTAAHGMPGHREDRAMKNSHLPASPVCLNSQIRSQGMYNLQHLSEALAIFWAHLPARLPRQIHSSHEHSECRNSPPCGHKDSASILLCSRGEGDKKRWNWRL